MARGRQVTRQWSLLRALEGARRGLSVEDLVGLIEDGCTSRTVYRDLEMLQEVGFPISNDEGRWQIEAAGTSPAMPIKTTEALALIVSEELLAPLRSTWVAEPLHELSRRLMATMTPAGRAYVNTVKDTVTATYPGVRSYESHRAVIAAVHDAIQKEQQLQITYTKPQHAAERRVVEPYVTWFHAGGLYVVAYCHRAEDMRIFAVQRMSDALVLDETFEPDPQFDASAFTAKGFGVFHGASYRYRVDFHPRVAHLVTESQAHTSQRTRTLDNGWTRVSWESTGLPEVAAWVCGFGGNACPISPPELVEEVRSRHESALTKMNSPDDLV